MDFDVESSVTPATTSFRNGFSSDLPGLGPSEATYRRYFRYSEVIRKRRDACISGTLGPIRDPDASEPDFRYSNNIPGPTGKHLNGVKGLPFFNQNQEHDHGLNPINKSVSILQDPKTFIVTPNISEDPQSDKIIPFFQRLFENVLTNATASQRNKSPCTETGLTDLPEPEESTEITRLARKLKGRHLQMITVAGSMGTGLFVASGLPLEIAGPGSLILSYAITGLMLYCTCRALGELAVLFPVPGSFIAYSGRFLDPAWGFAIGWNYALNWLLTLPFEVIAAVRTLRYWHSAGNVNPAVWVTLFLVVVCLINLFDVRVFGETEFMFSLIKLITIVGFVILGLVVDLGGGPHHQFIGARYWHNPGAFTSGFTGFINACPTAAFAFMGTEMVGICAAEADCPAISVPKATKQIFWMWRIVFMYLVSLIVVSLLVPSNDPAFAVDLDIYTASSPFVIALRNSGIKALPSIMNAVIFIAVLSAGSSSVYGASRTLVALALNEQAPAFLATINRSGTPLVAVILSTAFGLLGYIVLVSTDTADLIFIWLLATCGFATLLTWASICLCHIRFRRAWRVQGHDLEELPSHSRPSVVGSWLGLLLNLAFQIAMLVMVLKTLFQSGFSASDRSQLFFEQYLAIPIVVVTYLIYKFTKGTQVQRALKMDIDSGRREYLTAKVLDDLQKGRFGKNDSR